MLEIFMCMWKNKLKAHFFFSFFLVGSWKKQAMEWILQKFRFFRNAKSLNLTVCGYNGFPLGHYYLNHTIHCFWPSFFRVSVQYRSLLQAKEAQMGGYSCSSSNRLQKPAGTLPQLCLSILWAGATPPCSGLCWVCHRTLAKSDNLNWSY